jgi:hypothetical protein
MVIKLRLYMSLNLTNKDTIISLHSGSPKLTNHSNKLNLTSKDIIFSHHSSNLKRSNHLDNKAIIISPHRQMNITTHSNRQKIIQLLQYNKLGIFQISSSLRMFKLISLNITRWSEI